MRLTAGQLNRATLGRQLLLRREPLGVVEGVRRITAMQAQEAASPYIALWNRLMGFDPGALDAAFAEGTVVKASLIRLTLHAVVAGDYRAFHGAMLSSLRASRLNDGRFTTTGLTTADADALEALVQTQLGERDHPRAWWARKTFAPMHHAPTGGAWSFGAKSSFVAAPAVTEPLSPEESVQWLVRRYLEAFGPASALDFAQFTMLRRPVVAAALEALAGTVEELEGPDGAVLYDVPGGLRPPEDAPAPPRLLPMWDSLLLAYSDRSRVIPPDYRRLIIRQNGDVLPTLLVDGHIAGVWRPLDGGIEATAFHPLSDETWAGLATEATALVAFLAAREPIVYRRYVHWWKTLPGADVRLLPG